MTCDIFIRSYDGDAEWLKYCLRSIQRFATGFQQVVVVVPNGHNPPTGTNEVVFKVAEIGDQYMQQQSDKLHADHFTDAEFILYQDSDTIFTQPVTPATFIVDNRRPVWLYTPYAQLGNDESQLWKEVTSKVITFDVDLELMRRHPFCISRNSLQAFRQFIHLTHGVTAERYVMSQPAHEFSEFNALGSFMWYFHQNKVEWKRPEDFPTYVHQSYSYGGLNPDLRAHLEAALA